MTVFLVDLEAVDTRYTGQWKTHVPALLKQNKIDVTVIDGPTDIPAATTPGAFLNFGGTNIYKSEQVSKIGRLFCDGKVVDGDYFLFTDAWHPGIINVKYMIELLGIKAKIGALWHAGSYDPQDFLGRLIGDAPWVRNAERSFFYAIDHNYFATKFHVQMFERNLLQMHVGDKWSNEWANNKIVITGWPFENLKDNIIADTGPIDVDAKEDIILFPHRIAPEKQVDIFKDLATALPQYKFIVCQEQHLTKPEYHKLLAKSKMVFSANLQETLGISCYEALCVDAMPFVPDRLSYTEMYPMTFKYESEWTESWDDYLANKDVLVDRIRDLMDAYNEAFMQRKIRAAQIAMTNEFFSAHELIKTVKAHQ